MKDLSIVWRHGRRAAKFLIPDGSYALPVNLELYRVDCGHIWFHLASIQCDSAFDAWSFLQAWTEFDLRHHLADRQLADWLESQ